MQHLAPPAAPGRPLAGPFARRTAWLWLTGLLLALLLASAACNTTPTLPLPPPLASASTPDEQGFALVSGQSHALAYVSVLNERTDNGVITRADSDGKYEARIAAQIGDLLTIWQEVAGEAGELKQTVVPAPR